MEMIRDNYIDSTPIVEMFERGERIDTVFAMYQLREDKSDG